MVIACAAPFVRAAARKEEPEQDHDRHEPHEQFQRCIAAEQNQVLPDERDFRTPRQSQRERRRRRAYLWRDPPAARIGRTSAFGEVGRRLLERDVRSFDPEIVRGQNDERERQRAKKRRGRTGDRHARDGPERQEHRARRTRTEHAFDFTHDGGWPIRRPESDGQSRATAVATTPIAPSDERDWQPLTRQTDHAVLPEALDAEATRP